MQSLLFASSEDLSFAMKSTYISMESCIKHLLPFEIFPMVLLKYLGIWQGICTRMYLRTEGTSASLLGDLKKHFPEKTTSHAKSIV